MPRLVGNPYLLLALASLFWSGNHVIGRAAAHDVPPFGIATLRWALPALFLYPFARQHLARDWPLIKRHWGILVLLSLTGGSLFSGFQYLGLHYTTALNVSVLNSFGPALIAAVAAVLFRDRLLPVQMVGIATSFLGVLIIIMKLDAGVAASLQFNIGDLLILFNMLLWAIYSAYLRLVPRIHWLSFTCVLGAVAALGSAPVMVWEYIVGWRFEPTALTAFTILYVAIFPSVLAYAAWSRGVELIGGNRAGPFLHLIPLYSALLAYTFLGEQLMAYHLLGFALILCGVYFAARSKT
jgi:drug/metabolite transporter (DMT)-like permease